MLVTVGTESFKDYFERMFDFSKKEDKKLGFLKQVKGSKEYKDLMSYMDETIKTSNHPKLRKLADLLTIFFSDPLHADKSKVIVFT